MGISDERFKTHFLFPPEDDHWYDKAADLVGALGVIVGAVNALPTFDGQCYALRCLNRYLGWNDRLGRLVEDGVEWKDYVTELQAKAEGNAG